MSGPLRRGISPVIATVVIVAVAIAIALAVAGWLYGVYGQYTGYEAVRVLPASYADAQADRLVLYIANDGTLAARVVAVEVMGVQASADLVVEPGEVKQLAVDVPTDSQGSPLVDIQPGEYYEVRVITERGVYVAVVPGR